MSKISLESSSNPAKKVAISVLMNFHREGFLAQTTIASAKAAVTYFKNRRLGDVQVIAVIDSGSNITDDVVQRNADFIDVIERVDYRDLAQSRNHGVRAASGKFVAFLDGDDLWGESWLARAYAYMETLTSPIVLHTEFFIAFGRENFARVQWDSFAPEFDALTLMQNWHFCNNSFASRDLLLANPFISYDHDSGFGSEDWHWSCETLARGIRHAPVPETAYFYRMRNDVMACGGDSHLGLGAKGGLLVRPSALFTPEAKQFKRHHGLVQDLLILPPGELPQQLKSAPTELPDSILEEWRLSGKIDPDCFPTKHIRDTLNIFRPDIHYSLTRLYRKFFAQVHDCEDFIFLEFRSHKETLEAMNAVLGKVNRRTAVFVMSEIELHEDAVDENIVVVPLWKTSMSALIGGNEIVTLITRLLLQLVPRNVINLWSSFASEAVLIPYARAFETLGIQIHNAVYSDKTTDLFNQRFRSEWLAAKRMGGTNTTILTPHPSGADVINHRSLLAEVQSVKCLFGGHENIANNAKTVLTTAPTAGIDISCVLNVHREKDVMKPTILSLIEMLKYTHVDHACALELIIVLDRTDKATRELVNSAKSEIPCPLIIKEVDNGNLAISRNDGISASSGKYVALFDADDLYGRNWLTKAMDSLAHSENPERAVMHPQYNIYFGAEKRIFEHRPLHPGDSGAFGLAFTNYWTSLLFAQRDLLQWLPFDPIDFSRGFAFEDWSWNLKALRHGVSHLVAPDTAHYIRLKKHGSLNAASVNAGAIYRPAGLFKESFK
ncbi:glycosyltransferase family 2 protein [Massilia sp. NP310]|uniref:glycosyltransferase family 2 protein n=1 Tax=Massilia sp. NP310 TaxID=2861282 RepID=UPI001C631D8C|nr:glycosyltransferase family 2 protein [Massilia sp. NP310]QYG04237.1 glycosyltransferase [Massilia sp. NP310]